MLKHLLESLADQREIFLGEAGPLRQVSRHKSVGTIKPIRHDPFVAHCAVVAALRLGLALGGHRHARYRDIQRLHWVDRASESQLHRPADLPRVELGRHHRAERADVEKVSAHPLSDRPSLFLLFRQLFRFMRNPQLILGALVLVIEYGSFTHIDLIALLA